MNQRGGILTVFPVAFTCILAGGLFGAACNAINGAISPYYFKAVMHWNSPHIWSSAVAEGVTEGLIYGILFSVIFTTGFGIITGGKGSYGFALRQLVKTVSFAGICWLVGGVFAMLLSSLNPDFYNQLFPVTPKGTSEILKFAWVGGSIWGGMIGGVMSAILGVVILRNRWHALINPDEED